MTSTIVTSFSLFSKKQVLLHGFFGVSKEGANSPSNVWSSRNQEADVSDKQVFYVMVFLAVGDSVEEANLWFVNRLQSPQSSWKTMLIYKNNSNWKSSHQYQAKLYKMKICVLLLVALFCAHDAQSNPLTRLDGDSQVMEHRYISHFGLWWTEN